MVTVGFFVTYCVAICFVLFCCKGAEKENELITVEQTFLYLEFDLSNILDFSVEVKDCMQI